MKKNILNELGKRIVFFDGGMGTLLQERGLEAGELPENWNLKHPDIIRELHRDYLNAGADIILANTFGANELKFPDNLEEIVTKGVQNAKKRLSRDFSTLQILQKSEMCCLAKLPGGKTMRKSRFLTAPESDCRI